MGQAGGSKLIISLKNMNSNVPSSHKVPYRVQQVAAPLADLLEHRLEILGRLAGRGAGFGRRVGRGRRGY